MSKVKFLNSKNIDENKRNEVQELAEDFIKEFKPLEKANLHVLIDWRTESCFTECHIKAKNIISKGTIDVSLDPDDQMEYRANRELVDKHPSFARMKEDANKMRMFSNVVAEYNPEYDEGNPLKIIGGQHRFIAIEDALGNDIDEYHGVKVYFGLDTEQRLDVQLISNTNISVSNDLLDRMFETVLGPELRTWCQKTNILANGEDFADRKQKGSQITVRGARTFIINYLAGREIDSKNYDSTETIPSLCKTGGEDEVWQVIRNDDSIWEDKKLLKAGKEFALLNLAQRSYYSNKPKQPSEFSDKVLSLPVICSWAFIAGVLENNVTRLKRHFALKDIPKADPLNSAVLAKGKHKTDADNYRGVGTRTDIKDRGRLTELFFLQAEKGMGIKKPLLDLAIKKFHAKQAMLEVIKAEQKL